MNTYMQNKWSWVEGTHGMRNGLIATLADSDLAFCPGGNAMTLGALFREIGDVQYAYIQSLKTFKTDFTYRNNATGIENSVAQLSAWYVAMDAEMKSIIEAFSDADFQGMIARSSGYQMPVEMQLDVYLQALLIFFGKVTVYLKIMKKPVDATIQEYIG